MANDLPKVGAEAVLIHDKYDRDIADVIKRADDADKALSDISGIVDVKINVNDSDIGAAYASLLDLENDASVKVNVEDSELNMAKDTVEDIDGADPNVKVNADDAELEKLKEKLDTIRNLAVIDLILHFDNAQLESIPILGTLMDIENQVKRIEGQTGEAIPGAAGVINDLYVNAWGDSRDAIADLIIELDRAGIAFGDLEGVATDVFEAAAVSGEDPIELFRRMDTLVKNDLVSSFSEAADFIAGGFQTGLGRGEDFLDTIDEYTQVLSDAGLSADGFFEILNAGQDAGVRNTDKLADAYKEMFNLTKEETGRFNEFGEETDRTQALGLMGLGDEASAYAAGEITGDEFAAGLLEGLRAIEDPEEQRLRALAIFNPSMVEDVGLPGLLAADLESNEVKDAWEGAADEGAAALSETLGTTITELQRTIETELSATLDETFDLTDRLDTAREQFQAFIDEIQGGETVGDAIEIAFGIPGVDEALKNIERVFGNMLIGILEAVAFIQDPTGTNDNDKSTRAEIARLAEGQFAFDIQVANPAELEAIIEQAIGRGVDQSTLSEMAGKSVDELIASGEIEKAQALVDSFADFASNALPTVAPGIGGVGLSTANAALLTASVQEPGWEERIQRELEAGNLIAPVSIDTAAFQAEIDAAIEAEKTRLQNMTGGITPFSLMGFDESAANFTAGMETSIGQESWWDQITPPAETIDTAKTAINDLGLTTEQAMNNAAMVTGLANDSMIATLAAMSDGFISAEEEAALMDQGIAESLTGNTVTASFDAVALSANTNFPVVVDWADRTGDAVAEMDARIMGLRGGLGVLSALATSVAEFPLDRLQAITNAAMGYSGAQSIVDNSNNETNVTVNNNNSNGAQASTTTYDIARAVGVG